MYFDRMNDEFIANASIIIVPLVLMQQLFLHLYEQLFDYQHFTKDRNS